MKFGTYKTYYKEVLEHNPHSVSVAELPFYEEDYSVEWARKYLPVEDGEIWDLPRQRLWAEGNWTAEKRPFFNVYPYIADCAKKFDTKAIKRRDVLCGLKMNSILCLFPESFDFTSMLMGIVFTGSDEGHWITLMVHGRGHGRQAYCSLTLASSADLGTDPVYEKTIDEHELDIVSDPMFSRLPNIAVFMALAQSNKDLLEPIICERYQHLPHDEAVRKSVARRGGQACWNVGKSIEATPHYRRPHMATFWTGKGSSVPCIKLRHGCVVSREKATKMPTGYLLGVTNDTNSNNHSS